MRLLLLGLFLSLAAILACGEGAAPTATTLIPTATRCPAATPEPFWVEPVTTPTDELSQVVAVHIGNGEVVTINTESGSFSAYGNPALVDVILLPNTTHYLAVRAKVGVIGSGGCTYGGYTLSTRISKDGVPLVIQQGQPAPTRLATNLITPDNAFQLEPLVTMSTAGEVRDLIFMSNDKIISVGSNISQWDVETGRELDRISARRVASSADISPDQSLLVTGAAWAASDSEGNVRLWDIGTGDMKELGYHKSFVEGVAFNPNGARVATGGRHNKVWIWDVVRGQSIITLEGDVPQRNQSFGGFHWMDDDTLIAAGSDAIYWWNVTTGRLLQRLARPEESAFFVDVAFSQNGGRLAAAAQDNAIYFWDSEVSKWAIWHADPGSSVSKVAFSPDGRLLAAATYEGELLLWNINTQEWLVSHSIPTDNIHSIRFSPDGRYIAVVGSNQVIWLWGIP